MGGKTKEQLLGELLEVQKMLEKRTEAQGQMIKRFQKLIANEGLFSQIIDLFPYPLAIFTSRFTLFMINKAFAEQIKPWSWNPGEKAPRIFQHKIGDIKLAAAIKKVFAGDTFFLEDLKNPFSIFSGIAQENATRYDGFHRVVIFPVAIDDATITHGVIVFMP